jgi:hypothetical protein
VELCKGSRIGNDQKDEERYDALEGHGLEEHPKLRLVSLEAGHCLSLFPSQLCSLPEVFCKRIALALCLDAEIVYTTCANEKNVMQMKRTHLSVGKAFGEEYT